MRKKIPYLLLLSLVLWVSACGNKKQETVEEPKFTQAFTHSADIGDPAIKGDVSFNESAGVYTLSGGGENMWFQSDEFFFVYEQIEGDFSLSSQITFAPEVENSNPHRKVGLMIRESLEPDARYADIAVHSGDGLTSLQYRPAAGAGTEEIRAEILSADFITLERKANQIIVKTGKGDFTDAVAAGLSLDFPAHCYVGLFICSHDSTVKETAYFSQVKLEK